MILYSTDSRQAPYGACPVISATSESSYSPLRAASKAAAIAD